MQTLEQEETSENDSILGSSHDSAPPAHEVPGVKLWEYDDPLVEDDPETIARKLLQAEFIPRESSSNGNGYHDDGLRIEGPDFRIEPPAGDPHVSADKVTVEVPKVFLLLYDHFRDHEGWAVGDGSFSSFVTDMLLDHLKVCLDHHAVVAHGWELREWQKPTPV